MDLAPYVGGLHQELVAAAEVGSDEVRAVAERFVATLESATRLTLLNALAAAADEITRDLAPGSVDVRLRGGDPHFVVTSLHNDDLFDDSSESTVPDAPVVDDLPQPAPTTKDGSTSRINFRPPEHLKLRIEEAAAREGLSVNTWLVRTVTGVFHAANAKPQQQSSRRGQRYQGWIG